jgi:hypothetical protein
MLKILYLAPMEATSRPSGYSEQRDQAFKKFDIAGASTDYFM